MTKITEKESSPFGDTPIARQDTFEDLSLSTLVSRSVFGGVLMGLANLVPGISGGTMLLASGIYPRFVTAVAEFTRFRFRFHSILLLCCVGISASLGILLFAGLLKDLVLDHRWVMYSLFIGLTLGGVPVVWRLAKPFSVRLLVSASVAFLLMVGVALLQAYNVVGGGGTNALLLFIAGLAGASAMILPGVSGGYLLLLLGQYVPILTAIDQFKDAIKARDFSAAMDPAVSVVLPVGLGVLAGVAIVGNLLQWCMLHFQRVTLGALLGLLVGSTVGLYPFQNGIEPRIGDVIKGQIVTTESISRIEKDDWPTQYFSPNGFQIVGALVCVGLGMGLTAGISRIGNGKKESTG